jgi:fructose-bisphosphate aldolase class II
MALGAVSLALHVHNVASRYNILVGLHTDHCHPSKLDKFVKPLIAETEKRRAAGLPNLFNSHMFDGSELSMDKNIAISEEL